MVHEAPVVVGVVRDWGGADLLGELVSDGVDLLGGSVWAEPGVDD